MQSVREILWRVSNDNPWFPEEYDGYESQIRESIAEEYIRELNDLLIREATPYKDPCDREEHSIFEGIKLARNAVMLHLIKNPRKEG